MTVSVRDRVGLMVCYCMSVSMSVCMCVYVCVWFQLLALNDDALQPGAAYPDAFYSYICYQGITHSQTRSRSTRYSQTETHSRYRAWRLVELMSMTCLA